jgi:cytochrome c peroxidase
MIRPARFPGRWFPLHRVWLIVLAGCSAAGVLAADLALRWAPEFAGRPLTFESPEHTNAAGQVLSFTRLDFLVSGLALRRADGVWVPGSPPYAFVNAREGELRLIVRDLPDGRYTGLRFQVGVPPDVNHQDAATWPPGHPLNPTVNGLHWGWLGGYVFAAVEGTWNGPAAERGGFSFHLATDAQLMTVELPIELTLPTTQTYALSLDLAHLWQGPDPWRLNAESATTHSREGDALAGRLARRLSTAFRLGPDSAAPADRVADRSAQTRPTFLMAPGATPWRLVIPGTFPRPALPLDNPLTEPGVALGRRLFHDGRLSGNGSQSCAACHDGTRAFADGRPVSHGADGVSGTRNSMPLFNLAWKSSFFWDGRTTTLREQVLQPITNALEMHATLPDVVAGLAGDTDPTNGYPAAFQRAFGTTEITADRVARALEQFLLVQVAGRARFDQVQRGEARFTATEQRGFELFHTEYDPRRGQTGADCFHCHGGPLFQSQRFANNGLDAVPTDPGRGAVTGRAGDQGRFAVPSLRNVSRTAPYMHDGRFATLAEVVKHYTDGVQASPTLDPNLAKHPVGGVPLSAADQAALIAFLETLTDLP